MSTPVETTPAEPKGSRWDTLWAFLAFGFVVWGLVQYVIYIFGGSVDQALFNHAVINYIVGLLLDLGNVKARIERNWKGILRVLKR